MNEHPILMSGPMIRAILEGKKTQTRRVMKPQPIGDSNYLTWKDRSGLESGAPTGDAGWWFDCPYGIPGDSLWVRETWTVIGWAAKMKTSELTRAYDDMIVYKADCDKPIYHDWRPSIYMPRWASRLTLEVTGVRVERVQDISEQDAIAEGVEAWAKAYCSRNPENKLDPVEYFGLLWNSINTARGFDWAVPFVFFPATPKHPAQPLSPLVIPWFR